MHEQGPHGVFAVHGYPIGNGVSTFIVETDERSWREAGLDAFDVSQPPGPSDQVTQAYLEKLFATQIDGCPLLVNNSRWGNFRTWRTQRWRHRAGQPDRRRPARRRRAHRALLRRLGHQDGHGGRHRAGGGAGRGRARTLTASTRRSPSTRPNGTGRSPGSRTPPGLRCRGGNTSAGPTGACRRGSSPSTSSAARCPSPSCASATRPSSSAVHRAWAAAHGGAADPLRTPIAVAGATQPDRV